MAISAGSAYLPLFEKRVAAPKLALANTEDVGNRFEALNPSDNFSWSNSGAGFCFKPTVDYFPQHACGEFCQTNAPQPRILWRQPSCE
jgi:hypothetical protein